MFVFVTGATGFVGRHVATALGSAGHRLRCLVRSPDRARHLADAGHELVVGDLFARAAITHALEGADAVVHVAGLISARSPGEMRHVNVTAAGLLAASCASSARPPRRFVLISSLAAGGPSDGRDGGVCEDDDARPVSVYGASKLDGERAVRRALPPATDLTIVRPPAVYGPHDRGILDLFRAAARGLRVLPGSRRRPVSIVHAADLADAVVRALESPRAAGRTYYVANDESHPMDELTGRIADAVGRPAVPLRVPDAALQAAGVVSEELARVRDAVPLFSRDKAREFLAPGWVCDARRAREELGWTPRVPLDDGLRETADWYRQRRWI